MAHAALAALSLVVAAPSARGEEVIGAVRAHRIARGESLVELARAYDLGFNEIAAANPRLDPFVPEVGANAVVPASWILPRAWAVGALVVNLSEMRLYFAAPRGGPRLTFPIGVAVEDGATPLGVLTVVSKEVAPTWYPPPSVRAEDPSLPAAVPPGPENPLGGHALRLSMRTILVHGTNRPFGVGRKVSRGCVRLYPEDIERLFPLVDVGARVVIVREPVKVGVRDERIFVEIHEDPAAGVPVLREALRLLRARGLLERVDRRALVRAARARSGVPVEVTASDAVASRAAVPPPPHAATVRATVFRP